MFTQFYLRMETDYLGKRVFNFFEALGDGGKNEN
jgi:hypothetical protein